MVYMWRLQGIELISKMIILNVANLVYPIIASQKPEFSSFKKCFVTEKLCNFMGVLNSIDTAFLLIMLKIKQTIFNLQFCETLTNI